MKCSDSRIASRSTINDMNAVKEKNNNGTAEQIKNRGVLL